MHPREYPLAVLGVDPAYQLVGIDALGPPEVDGCPRVHVEDVPRLGLAVGAGQVGGREGPVRVDMDRKPLAGVEQLEQQPGVVVGDPRPGSGAAPAPRVGGDQVAQQPSLFADGQADNVVIGAEHG